MTFVDAVFWDRDPYVTVYPNGQSFPPNKDDQQGSPPRSCSIRAEVNDARYVEPVLLLPAQPVGFTKLV